MNAKTNDAGKNGALSDMATALSMPGLQVSQRIALEAAKFSARRMRAYADQMEALVDCGTPAAFIAAQTRFFEQMQQDYAAERETVAALMSDTAREAIAQQQR